MHHKQRGLTHFTHEGVEALPMLITVKQQLPHITLHSDISFMW